MFIGPPGSGKGTQAVRVAGQLSISHISTGDILRAAVKAESPLGRAVAATLAAGALVSDEVITDLVRDRLQADDANQGFILDGFPRTLAQARALDTMRPPEDLRVILIDVADDAIVRRLSSRRVCDACAISQSVSPGEAAGREMCPYCGGNLVRRADDCPDTVRHRLATYASAAASVLDLYRARHGFVAIDGLRHADEVTADILAFVRSPRRS
ncbi:MAG TPA: adenylate kinase [Vicinamibacterales bacterium]